MKVKDSENTAEISNQITARNIIDSEYSSSRVKKMKQAYSGYRVVAGSRPKIEQADPQLLNSSAASIRNLPG